MKKVLDVVRTDDLVIGLRNKHSQLRLRLENHDKLEAEVVVGVHYLRINLLGEKDEYSVVLDLTTDMYFSSTDENKVNLTFNLAGIGQGGVVATFEINTVI